MGNMTEEQAFNVIGQGLSAANKAGVFELKDSATIFAALGVLAQHFQPQDNGPGPELVKEEDVAPKGKKK
jgi:hypothetical protein